MTIKRIPLPTVAENRRARGPQPLTPAHKRLIEALAEKVVADLEPDPPAAPAPEKGTASE